ncbi:MAG: histidine--tRNA ligase [Puniceicoccales bacterium]|jgi:histidyl-tRNA synthetase|nr:histidine--tRNA ligase [Puniceicoccales bacterium]
MAVVMETLPGFRDFYPTECAVRNVLFTAWREVAHRFHFLEFDSPILEPLELFTEKSGEEIREQLFAFEDRGGRKVALRPETTPSLVRLIGTRAASLKKPIKWFNITENFRYERPQKGRLRSFYQFNVDIVGEGSFSAEAELIALAIESFSILGLGRQHFYIRLSDRQIWILWLQALGIEESRLQVGLLNVLDKWERREREDLEKDALRYLSPTASVQEFLIRAEQLRQSNTLQEIRGCFDALNPNNTLKAAVDQRLLTWGQLLEELDALQYGSFVRVDLGIVRGLAYYTGFVFEVFEADLNGRALAGGGRYDLLFEKLTGHALPAVGFAMGDVTLLDVLQKYHLLPKITFPLDCFVIFENSTRRQALQDVGNLRQNDLSVTYILGEGTVSKQFKKALEYNPNFILFYRSDELRNNQVQVKHVSTHSVTLIEREKLVNFVCNYTAGSKRE